MIICLVLLVFAGCSSDSGAKQSGIFGGGTGSSSGSSSSSNAGVVLEFAQGNPPSEMFKGQDYTFAFVFKNAQEHPVEDLQVKVSGFDTGFVSGLSPSYSVAKIPAASSSIGDGVYSGLVVSGVSVDGFEGNFNFNPVFDYCYTAKTKYIDMVCVPSKNNQCTADYTSNKKQNGPLSLSVDKINSIGDEIQITFTLQNSGKGQTVNECFNTNDYGTKYTINSVKLGTTVGTCNPRGAEDFLLGNGKANFYCTFPRSGDDSYASQLTAEIEYLYQQQLKKSFKVVDPSL
jgi:hypothetical protein